jgi:hypothetical protein
MEKIKSIKELREAIAQLENKQLEDKRLLKEQLMVTYEAMKPINLIKKSMKDLFASTDLKRDIMNALIGLLVSYLSKKSTGETTSNSLIQQLGAFLKSSFSKVVENNTSGIKSALLGLARGFLSKQKVNENIQTQV